MATLAVSVVLTGIALVGAGAVALVRDHQCPVLDRVPYL